MTDKCCHLPWHRSWNKICCTRSCLLLQFSRNVRKKKSGFQRRQFKEDLLPSLPGQTDCVANCPRPFAKHISVASSAPLPKVGFIFLHLTRPHLAPLMADAVLHSTTSGVLEKSLRSSVAANPRGCDSEQHNKAGLHWLQCGLALNNVWNNNVWVRQQTSDHLCYKTETFWVLFFLSERWQKKKKKKSKTAKCELCWHWAL